MVTALKGTIKLDDTLRGYVWASEVVTSNYQLVRGLSLYWSTRKLKTNRQPGQSQWEARQSEAIMSVRTRASKSQSGMEAEAVQPRARRFTQSRLLPSVPASRSPRIA